MWVYVSGPYTGGDTAINVVNAIDAGFELREMGHVPIVPHLSHFMHMRRKKPYRFWMEFDLDLLARCDAIIRLPGESPGADEEVAAAEAAGKPVYYSLEAIPRVRA